MKEDGRRVGLTERRKVGCPGGDPLDAPLVGVNRTDSIPDTLWYRATRELPVGLSYTN